MLDDGTRNGDLALPRFYEEIQYVCIHLHRVKESGTKLEQFQQGKSMIQQYSHIQEQHIAYFLCEQTPNTNECSISTSYMYSRRLFVNKERANMLSCEMCTAIHRVKTRDSSMQSHTRFELSVQQRQYHNIYFIKQLSGIGYTYSNTSNHHVSGWSVGCMYVGESCCTCIDHRCAGVLLACTSRMMGPAGSSNKIIYTNTPLFVLLPNGQSGPCTGPANKTRSRSCQVHAKTARCIMQPVVLVGASSCSAVLSGALLA